MVTATASWSHVPSQYRPLCHSPPHTRSATYNEQSMVSSYPHTHSEKIYPPGPSGEDSRRQDRSYKGTLGPGVPQEPQGSGGSPSGEFLEASRRKAGGQGASPTLPQETAGSSAVSSVQSVRKARAAYWGIVKRPSGGLAGAREGTRVIPTDCAPEAAGVLVVHQIHPLCSPNCPHWAPILPGGTGRPGRWEGRKRMTEAKGSQQRAPGGSTEDLCDSPRPCVCGGGGGVRKGPPATLLSPGRSLWNKNLSCPPQTTTGQPLASS